METIVSKPFIDKTTRILRNIVETIWKRSDDAMLQAAMRETEAFFQTKDILDNSLKPLAEFFQAIRQGRQEAASLDVDAQVVLEEILRYRLPSDAQATLALQALLVSGTSPAFEDRDALLPGRLLRAGAEIVPFAGRARAFDELFEVWLNDDPITIYLILGPVGAGKTRLMVEWTKRLAQQGDIAGFLPRHITEADVDLLFGGKGRRTVVVDDAEHRVSLVKAILAGAAQGARREAKLHLVLLARHDGEWWAQMGEGASEIQRIAVGRSRRRTLRPLLEYSDDRQAFFNRACERFASLLHRPLPGIPVPDFTLDHFGRPLFVQMAALAAVNGRTVSAKDDLIRETVDHEKACWKQMIDDRFAPKDARQAIYRTLERLLPVIFLWGGADDRTQTRDLIDSDPGSSKTTGRWGKETNDILWCLYGETVGGVRRLCLPAPDVLGEQLVFDALSKDAALLTLAADKSGDAAEPHLLAVLTRLAQRTSAAAPFLQKLLSERLEALFETAMAVAVDIGDPMGGLLANALRESGDVRVAEEMMARCPKHNGSLREVGLESTKMVYDHFRKSWTAPNEDQYKELARLADDLGNRHSELGQLEAAFAVTTETVAMQRKLSTAEPDLFLPHLARSLNNLGILHHSFGRCDAALEVTFEAVEIYRKLSDVDPETYLPDLAMSLNNLGNRYNALGRHEEALAVTFEAVDIRRELSVASPDAYLPVLARSLNNLGNRYSSFDRREDALEVTFEAVEIYRKLSAADPDAYLPDLAMTLNNLGIRYNAIGRREEALAVTSEAVDIRRKLSERCPDIYLPDLAMSLNNLGADLSALGWREAALDVTVEAVDIYLKLSAVHSDTYLPDLAMSLNNLGIWYSALGLREKAVEVTSEAVEIRRTLAAVCPDAYLPDLARSLNNLGADLRALDRQEEALGVTIEAVDIYRKLSAARPDVHLPDLAMSLNNLGIRYNALGLCEEAMAVTSEAVDIRRKLSVECPEAYLPDLARSLNNLGIRYRSLDRHAAAFDAVDEALRIFTPLFLQSPAAYSGWMSIMLRNYIEYAEAAKREVDEALLGTIRPVLSGISEHP